MRTRDALKQSIQHAVSQFSSYVLANVLELFEIQHVRELLENVVHEFFDLGEVLYLLLVEVVERYASLVNSLVATLVFFRRAEPVFYSAQVWAMLQQEDHVLRSYLILVVEVKALEHKA